MKTRLIIKIVISLLLIILFLHHAYSLVLEPSTTLLEGDETVRVDVNVDNLSGIMGAQFILTFDPFILSFLSASEGEFLSNDSQHETYFEYLYDDESPNEVRVVVFKMSRNESSGSGTLASINLQSLANGIADIGLENVVLFDSSYYQLNDFHKFTEVTVSGMSQTATRSYSDEGPVRVAFSKKEEVRCLPDYERTSWTQCIDSKQFRTVKDNNNCYVAKRETRSCDSNKSQIQNLFSNAKEFSLKKLESRIYVANLGDEDYKEIFYTAQSSNDLNFEENSEVIVIVDEATQDEYLATLIQNESGVLYYTLEEVDESALDLIEVEGIYEDHSLSQSSSNSQSIESAETSTELNYVKLGIYGVMAIILIIIIVLKVRSK